MSDTLIDKIEFSYILHKGRTEGKEYKWFVIEGSSDSRKFATLWLKNKVKLDHTVVDSVRVLCLTIYLNTAPIKREEKFLRVTLSSARDGGV